MAKSVLLLLSAFLVQSSEAFFANPISFHALSKSSALPQCSRQFSLSKHNVGLTCALTSESARSATVIDRRHALGSLATAIALRLQPARAAETSSASSTKSSEKLFGLSNDKLQAMIEADIRDRQFLVTGQLTRYQCFAMMNSYTSSHSLGLDRRLLSKIIRKTALTSGNIAFSDPCMTNHALSPMRSIPTPSTNGLSNTFAPALLSLRCHLSFRARCVNSVRCRPQ